MTTLPKHVTNGHRHLEVRLVTLRRLLVKYGHLDEILALDEAWGEFARDINSETEQRFEPVFRAHSHQHLFPPKQPKEARHV
jgi:hypothetical protein